MAAFKFGYISCVLSQLTLLKVNVWTTSHMAETRRGHGDPLQVKAIIIVGNRLIFSGDVYLRDGEW